MQQSYYSHYRDKEMTDSYIEEDLYECCAIHCGRPGNYHLVLEAYTGTRYGYAHIQDGNVTRHQTPVIDTYYCKDHMVEQLESLANRIRLGGFESIPR